MKYSKGDVLSDCPSCGVVDGIVYMYGSEAACKSCGQTFEIELEEGEEIADDVAEQVAAPQQPPTPADVEIAKPHTPNVVGMSVPTSGTTEADSAFATPPVRLPKEPTIDQHQAEHAPPKIEVDGVGTLRDNPGQAVIPSDLKLKHEESDAAAEDLKLPGYIRSSRPWRWAQNMCNTGNPYRVDTKNHKIFLMISHGPTTVPQLIKNLVEQEPELCAKMSYLLTVYEVITQCIAAGLLIMDPQTGIITLCQKNPRPAQVP